MLSIVPWNVGSILLGFEVGVDTMVSTGCCIAVFLAVNVLRFVRNKEAGGDKMYGIGTQRVMHDLIRPCTEIVSYLP